MYAVVENGGKQYRVTPGEVVRFESMIAEPGSTVELGRVLAISREGELLAGDAVSGAKVTGTVEKHGRGEKVIVFKFKRKKQYKRTIGHRQNYTAVKIGEISA
jgi:large subunit ribosomal protein L21